VSTFIFRTRFYPLALTIIGAIILLAVLLILFNGTVEAVGVSIDLEQCANGRYGENTTCHNGGNDGWVTGNVNALKSEYAIGEFLPYRRFYTDLSVGSEYCFGMKWDIDTHGLPAIDYIATYNWTITEANPLWDTMFEPVGTSVVPPPSSTIVIPNDPVLITGTMNGNRFQGITLGTYILDDPERILQMWGGTLLSAGPYSNDGESGDLADFFSQSMEYCFIADEVEAVLAWSGHMADPVEWLAPGRPSGSPYHMANGTNNDLYTPPRTSETDLAVTAPDGTVTHHSIGRSDLQLALGSPTAITLSEVSLRSGSSDALFAFIAVAVVGLVSLTLVLYRNRSRRLGN
jgi:hypothetical protein